MDLNKLQTRLLTVRKSLFQIEQMMSGVETLSAERHPEQFEKVMTEIALHFESLTCFQRRILYDIYCVDKSEYLEKAAAAQGIKISYGYGVLEVTLPCLLPKKKGKNSNQFLIDPLNAALEQYNRTLPIPMFLECAVCFVHVYKSDRATRKYFDYDNLQQKQILDVIALHAMVDDNSLLCDVHHTSQPGDTDETKVFVMEKSRFPYWLEELQKA